MFPGAKAPYTETMAFLKADSYDGIPVYRVIDQSGSVIEEENDPNLDPEEMIKMYKVGNRNPFLQGRLDLKTISLITYTVDDHAQYDGQNPLRISTPRPNLVLHDELRRRGHAYRLRRRPRPQRLGLRSVQRSRRSHVPRIYPHPVHEPVLFEFPRPGQGSANACSLRIEGLELYHH